MADKDKCVMVIRAYRGVASHTHPCPYNAKVTRDGRRFCGRHDPVKVKRRMKKRVAKWDAETKQQAEQQARRVAELFACKDIPTEVLESGLLLKLYEQHQSAGRRPLQVRSVMAGGTEA